VTKILTVKILLISLLRNTVLGIVTNLALCVKAREEALAPLEDAEGVKKGEDRRRIAPLGLPSGV
jgi:hypothetical protein